MKRWGLLLLFVALLWDAATFTEGVREGLSLHRFAHSLAVDLFGALGAAGERVCGLDAAQMVRPPLSETVSTARRDFTHLSHGVLRGISHRRNYTYIYFFPPTKAKPTCLL